MSVWSFCWPCIRCVNGKCSGLTGHCAGTPEPSMLAYTSGTLLGCCRLYKTVISFLHLDLCHWKSGFLKTCCIFFLQYQCLCIFQTDPRHSAGGLSDVDMKVYRNQSIPTLSEILHLAKLHNTVVMFKIKTPPPWHPFYNRTMNVVLNVVHSSGISPSQVGIEKCRVSRSRVVTHANSSSIFYREGIFDNFSLLSKIGFTL